MPIYKRCSRCGKRIPAGTTCACMKRRHREYDKTSRNREADHFYHSPAWKRVRESVLEMDDGIDVYRYMKDGVIVRADTVHHINPLQEDAAGALDPGNLISLNHDTHSQIEQWYKRDREEAIRSLSAMVREYRESLR